MRHPHPIPCTLRFRQCGPWRRCPRSPLRSPRRGKPARRRRHGIEQQLQSSGCTTVHGLKFAHGPWQAGATRAAGKNVDVKVAPDSGEILADQTVSQVGKDDIRASLSTSGHSGARDIGFEGGMWQTKAKNADGDKVKLRLRPKHAGISASAAD